MKTTILAALLAAFILPANAHEGLVHGGCDPAATFTVGDLAISGAFSRAMLPNAEVAGGYLTIVNGGGDNDVLVGATSEAAETIQLHQMKMEGDVMKMSAVPDGVAIGAGETVVLAPGGLHLMFMGIGKPFKEGECVEVALSFERAGEVPVTLSIGGIAADGPAHGQGGL